MATTRSMYREALAARLPNLELLTQSLTSAIGLGGLTVLGREPNIYASTFPSEFVTCRVRDGNQIRLLCKYEVADWADPHGHHGQVAYEAAVYRDVLQPLQTTAPKFYGACRAGGDGETWLLIEGLDAASRADESPSPEQTLVLAAQWIGRFHRANRGRLIAGEVLPVNIYTAEYYRNWARRTAEFGGEWARRTGQGAGGWYEQLVWLGPLCERFSEVVDQLLQQPLTVIHGEFTPHNILISGDRICPIDWESAAIAVGEIDLASLTEGWAPDIVERCEAEYRQARWPDGAPLDFARRLYLARLYWTLRWLGHSPEWYPNLNLRKRLRGARTLEKCLGLL